MTLLVDSREALPLTNLFPRVQGVEIKEAGLPYGDYHALHGKDQEPDDTYVERKGLSDAFTAFSGANYEREKRKWQRAQAEGKRYLIAIEESLTTMLAGHGYRGAEGEWVESGKTGLALVRQLLTVNRKYGVEVHWFTSRKELAWWIVEFYLAKERIKN